MTDLTATIVPKSDQLNADDLIGIPSKTIRVTKVSLAAGEQPIAISFEGDGGKPYLPCKSMRRVLVQVWGSDGTKYVGRSMALYRDDKVKFAGVEVGGIRISHMSHMEKEMTMALTATKSSRKPFTVKPLKETGVSIQGSKGEVPANQGSLQGGDSGVVLRPKDSVPPNLFRWISGDGREVPFKTPEQWQDYVIKNIRAAKDAATLDDAFERNGTVTHEIRLAGFGEIVAGVTAALKDKMQNFNPIGAG